jgi:hypothetical protein
MKTTYAIKVYLSKDDWIYVTEPSGTMFEINPVLYQSRKQAELAASIWGKIFTKVVRYRKETT